MVVFTLQVNKIYQHFNSFNIYLALRKMLSKLMLKNQVYRSNYILCILYFKEWFNVKLLKTHYTDKTTLQLY